MLADFEAAEKDYLSGSLGQAFPCGWDDESKLYFARWPAAGCATFSHGISVYGPGQVRDPWVRDALAAETRAG